MYKFEKEFFPFILRRYKKFKIIKKNTFYAKIAVFGGFLLLNSNMQEPMNFHAYYKKLMGFM